MRRVFFALFLFFAPLIGASASYAEDVWWAQQINENDWTEVVAPLGWQIVYVQAWYGSDDGQCGYDVSDRLSEIAYGTTDFSFTADNDTFGDSCPGVYKVFRFTWGIVPLPDPVEPPVVDPPIIPDPQPTLIPVEPPIVIPDPPIIPDSPIIPDPPVVPDPPVIPDPPIDPQPPVIPDVPAVPDTPVNSPTQPEPPVVISPVVEPPVAVPTDNTYVPTPEEEITTVDPATIDPASLSDAEVAALITVAYATLESSEQGSSAYEQALEQLFVAAQADDFVVNSDLASVPLLGNAVVALADAVNYLGNVGADMSPKVRATAKKEVIAAVIVTQIATQAASVAMSASISSAGGIRRKL